MNFESVYEKDGKLYFFDNNISAICYTQDCFQTRVVLDKLPRSPRNNFTGLSIFGRDNSIFVNDMRGRRIIEYDLNQRSFHIHSFAISDDLDEIVVCDSILCCEKIVQFPVDLDARITVFDPEEKNFITKGLFTGNSMLGEKRGYYSADGELIAAPIYGRNVICIYDALNGVSKCIEFPVDAKLYSACIHNGIVYGVSDRELFIANGHDIKRIKIEGCIECEAFSRAIYHDEKVILLSRHSKSNYIYDIKNDAIIEVKLDKSFFPEGKEASSTFLGYYFMGEKMFMLPWRVDFVFELDLNSLETRKVFTTSIYNMKEKSMFNESKDINLNDFIASCCVMV